MRTDRMWQLRKPQNGIFAAKIWHSLGKGAGRDAKTNYGVPMTPHRTPWGQFIKP